MALGAIQAIEEYGLKPGEDIKIVSIDAVRGAFQAMVDGKLNVTVECNPLLGPQFYDLALKVVNGEEASEVDPVRGERLLPGQRRRNPANPQVLNAQGPSVDYSEVSLSHE